MSIYFISIYISIICAFISSKLKEKKKYVKYRCLYYIFCFLSFLPPFLVSAFRDISIGTDTQGTYYEIFCKALSKSNGVRDVGYYFINKICIFIYKDYRSVLIVTSLIITACAYRHIFSKSKNPMFSTYLFFTTNVYFISMNMIRQSIATMFFIFAIPYIKEKKFWKYLLVIAIAFSIHSSSIIYFPLYFLCNKKINKKRISIILIILLIFGRYLCSIAFVLLSKSSYFSHYFAWYITSSFNTGKANVVSLLISVCVLGVLFLSKNDSHEDFEYNCITWMQIIAFAFLSVSATFPMMQRMSWLFSFPLFIYLPKVINHISNKIFRILAYLGIALGYGAYMFVTIFMMHYNAVVPYTSIFN